MREKGKTGQSGKKLVTWGDLMPSGDISIAKKSRSLHLPKVISDVFWPDLSKDKSKMY